MAITYIEARILRAEEGRSVFGLGAYVMRCNAVNPVDGLHYDFVLKAADLRSVDVLLPSQAPPAFRNPLQLLAAMEESERTVDRKSKLPRFKKNAQLAKHIILALPKELSDAERRDLALAWAQSQYVDHGVAALVAVHDAADPEIGNHHAHLIVSTRRVTMTGFGLKARDLNPAFSRGKGHAKATLHAEDLPGQWRRFQDDWFRANGIELRVAPSQAVPGKHKGTARFVSGSDAAAADAVARAAAQELMRHPAYALQQLTRRRATFTRRDIHALLSQHGFSPADVVSLGDAILSREELIPLFDPESGSALPLFTTKAVRAQETRILAAADRLARGKITPNRRAKIAAKVSAIVREMTLTAEQETALRHLVDGPNLRLLRGIAGSGKSHTIDAARRCLEGAGYRVIGLAPTNTVACAMGVDGFRTASTVDLELLRQEHGSKRSAPWNRRTCLIIDEAAMIDANRFERLLKRAANAGARVILVGDEKQLASIERGGIFDEIKAHHGFAELLQVRRQSTHWEKAASQDLAAGRYAPAIAAYDAHGCIAYPADLAAAKLDLVRRWKADFNAAPAASRFVYASTNAAVDELNASLQNARWSGQKVDRLSFETTRGTIDLVVGDRLQLHGGDPQLKLQNGTVGTVTAMTDDRIDFVTDAGATLSFDPNSFQDWALGYAGTVYRGQGKTQDHVYALYDHKLAWHARSAYVAMTRHRHSLRLFVPRTLAADQAALARQMARADQNGVSAGYLDAIEAAALRRRLAKAAPTKPAVTIIPARAAVTAGPADGKAPTPPPGLPAIPYRTVLAGSTRQFDLSLASHREELVTALQREPMAQVVAVHRDIRGIKRNERQAAEVLQALHGQIATTNRKRAFLAGAGTVDRECLKYVRIDEDEMRDEPRLAPQGLEPDIRSLLFPLLEVDRKAQDGLEAWIKNFVPEAVRAIDDALISVGHRVLDQEELHLPVVNARSWLYRCAYGWGLDYHDAETWPQGQRPTPDEYDRDILLSSAEARRATRYVEPDDHADAGRVPAEAGALVPPTIAGMAKLFTPAEEAKLAELKSQLAREKHLIAGATKHRNAANRPSLHDAIHLTIATAAWNCEQLEREIARIAGSAIQVRAPGPGDEITVSYDDDPPAPAKPPATGHGARS